MPHEALTRTKPTAGNNQRAPGPSHRDVVITACWTDHRRHSVPSEVTVTVSWSKIRRRDRPFAPEGRCPGAWRPARRHAHAPATMTWPGHGRLSSGVAAGPGQLPSVTG